MCLWMPVACVCACVRVCACIYTKPRQQKFRAMNGAHLASPIRGELGYAHWPQLGTQFIALLGTKFGAHWGNKNFALTAAKFLFSNSGNFRAKAIPPKPRSCPKRPFGQSMCQNSSADWGSSEPLKTLVMLCNLLATFLVRALTTFNKKTYCLNLLPDIYPSRSACIIACVLLSVKILQVLVMLVSLVFSNSGNFGTICCLKSDDTGPTASIVKLS